MKKFKFEIQNCIQIEIEAETVEQARMQVINHLDDYAEDMLGADCMVSDGKEVV